MNKNLYRIVFNSTRGLRVAVQETASSCGKATGSTQSPAAQRPALLSGATCFNFRALSVAVFCALGGFSQWLPVAQAQVVADPSAPGSQRPTVLVAPNGVPVQNITTPSASGVSINQLSLFNVGSNGVILNNSRTNVQSQLGGWVQGNPWLATGSASKIVNQINSSHPSYINGYVEVAGQRAEVIIANPSGINVNGGGFINASRATLTTGTPIINGGNLEGYVVQKGLVNISGAGLDASRTDFTGIIARAVEVNAGIWANELKVTLGANTVDEAQTTATPMAGSGAAPAFALDVALLGGMYAGKITLVGTEAGVGVRNSGLISASAGPLTVTADGWLRNSGTMNGATAAAINTRAGIENSGTVYSQGNTQLTTQGNVSNSGVLAAQGNLTVAATGAGSQIVSTTGSLLAAGMKPDQSFVASGNIDLQAVQSLGIQGQSVSGGDQVLAAGSLDLSGGRVTGRNLTISAAAGDVNASSASLVAEQTLTATAAQNLHTNNAALLGAQVSLRAQGLSNQGGQIVQIGQGAMTVDLQGQLNNAAGSIVSGGPITINTGSLNNRGGTIEASGATALTLNASGAVDNSALGKIKAGGAVALTALSLNNSLGEVSAGTSLTGNVVQGINNTQGLLASNGNNTLVAGEIDNTLGTVKSVQGDLNLSTTRGAIDNTQGTLQAAGNLQMTSNGLVNTDGVITGQVVGINNRGQVLSNTGGTVFATQVANINSGTVTGGGKLLSQGDLNVTLSGDFTHTGEFTAGGNATLSVGGDLTNQAKLLAGQTLNVTAANINNTASGEMAAVNTNVTTTGTLTNRGLIDGTQTRINATTVNNIGTGRIFGTQLSIAANTLTNDAENGQSAVIAARNRLDLGVQTLTNREGALIFSGGDLSVGGSLDANRRATGQAQTVNNNSATIEALGALDISTRQLNNTNDHFTYSLVPEGTVMKNDYITAYGIYTDAEIGWLGAELVSRVVFGQYTETRFSPNLVPKTHRYGNARYQAYFEGPPAFREAFSYQAGFGEAIDTVTVPMVFSYTADSTVWADFGMARPAQSLWPYPPGSTVIVGEGEFYVPPSWSEVVAWQDASQPWRALQVKIDAFKAEINSTTAPPGVARTYSETSYTASTLTSKPAQILSGGAMTLAASDALVNDKSQIIAGGALNVTGRSVDNRSTSVEANTYRSGTLFSSGVVGQDCGWFGGCTPVYGQITAPYSEVIPKTITLALSVSQGNTQPPRVGSSLAAATLPSNLGQSNLGAITQIATSNPNHPAGLASVIRTTIPNVTVPGNSLFRVIPGLSSSYLIESDPRFTNYRTWLSSDYMLTALSLDPTTTQKRLGDGFYEQRLVNEQIAQLTGHRFLDGYQNEEAQYRTLMTNGVTVAQQYHLSPGIALTAAQMAQLTSDIVWLVEREVTLADGTKQKVLVPQVYVAVQPGDIRSDGSLLAGQSININLSGDLSNSGTIAGRNIVSLSANNVNNLLGRIQGEDVSVVAQTDLNNIGGVIQAQNSLSATAGRDLNVASTSQSKLNTAGVGVYQRTSLDRIAGLYVTNAGGTLVASAGRDINLLAAQLLNDAPTAAGQPTGSTSLSAGRDLNLGAIKEGEQSNATLDPRNYIRFGQSSDTGTTVSGQGAVTLLAGNNLNAKAASVTSEQGAAGLYAGNDVNLLAGASTRNLSTASFAEGSSGFSSGSTEIKSHLSVSNAQVTELKGDTASVFAGRDAVLEGTRIIARGNASVAAGNNVIAAAAQDSQSRGSSFETRSTGFTLDSEAFYDTRGRGNANLHETTTARGVEISSSQGNASLSAGGTAFVEGARINAPQGTASISGANVLIQAGVNTLFSSTTESKRDASSDGFFQMPGEGLGHKATQTSTIEQTSLARTTLAGQNVSITATQGDLHIAGTTVTTPGTLTLGATGTLYLDGQQVQTSRGEQSQSKDLMYQKMRDQGSIEQTTEYNQFNAGLIQLNAPRISAQIGTKNSVEQLASQPGMEWVGQLLNEPSLKDKVNWTQLKDASESWDYKKQGLTPEGAVIVSIVAAFVTWGAASGAGVAAGETVAVGVGEGVALSSGGVFLTATGTTLSTVVAGATTAGLTTLASQAAVSFINNQGDLGKVLEDLGSSQNVKALLTSMVTGGVLAGMNFDPTGAPVINGGSQTFMTQLGQNLKAGVAKSLISAAINGGSLEDSLKAGITSAFIDTAAAQGAFAIGQMSLDGFTSKLAHAIAGCAAGAARVGGGEGCAAGAIGAAVGEASAELYGSKADTVQFASMISAIAAAVAGGNVEQINLASLAGTNAAANNYLSEKQKDDKKNELAACQSALCKGGVNLKYLSIDAMQDAGLIIGVGGGIGYQSAEQAVAIVDLVKNLPETLTALSAIVTDPEFRAQVGNQIADDYKQRIDMQTRAYNDGGWDGSITAGVEAGRLAVDIVSVGAVALGAGKVIAVTTKAGVNAATASITMSANATVNFLENMALRNVHIGAINGFKSANEVNALMRTLADWSPAWKPGTQIAETTLKPGSKVQMVVSADDYTKLMTPGADISRSFGGWATFDNVPSQAYARNQLAITTGMKRDVSYVVEIQVNRPINAQIGVVGSQGSAQGGGNQLHFIIPPDQRASTFVVLSGKALP